MKTICELLNIEFPLIQGGMAHVANHKLASSVSNAGGLGIIASGANDATWLKEEISHCRKLTSKPFGVNIMLMNPHAEDLAQVVIDEGIKVVTTGAGSPGMFMENWKKHKITVLPVVASVALAKRMERYGADAVIVEGCEAGGHIGEQTTMALVPQVVDAVNIPVIAAGGIADYRQVLAAFSLGAKGVQVGTVLLATDECPIHLNYKERILQAKDTDTIVTGRQTKAPVRVLKNKMARHYIELAKQGATLEELERLTLGSLYKAVFEGDLDNGSFMAGQVSGLIRSIKPLRELFESMFYPIAEHIKRLDKVFKYE